MLSDAQRREFDERGIVRLPGAIAADDVEAMRERLWQELARRHGMQRDAPETWRCCRPSGFQQISRSQAFDAAHSPALREAAQQLLGPHDAQPVVQPLVNFPDAGAEWCVPHNVWHLDLPPTSRDAVPGLRAFSFLDEVRPHGGGTAVVTGSHRLVQRLARDADDGTQLSSRKVRKTLEHRQPWIRELFTPGPASDRIHFAERGAVVDGVPVRVVELTGAAGDVILMDLRLLHALTPNARSTPRLLLGQFLFANRRLESPRLS